MAHLREAKEKLVASLLGMWRRVRRIARKYRLALVAILFTEIAIVLYLSPPKKLNSQWALFIATVVLVAITVWYARATWVMAAQMKEQTEALVAPRMVVRVEKRDGNVQLVVENKGLSSARDLRLVASRPVPTCDEGVYQPLNHHRLFKEPPTHLTPGEKREILLGSEKWMDHDGAQYYHPTLTITVSYTWRDDEPITEETPIDVYGLWSLPQRLRISKDPDRG
jgi:hypothetical protein